MTVLSGIEYMEAMGRYYDLVASFPTDARNQFPKFDRFLSPANYSLANEDAVAYGDTIELSITGEQRYQMLQSPHAATLLRAWLAQRE